MTAAMITAICTGGPAVIGAITALVFAIKGNGKANVAVQQASNANAGVIAHLGAHDNMN